MNNNIDNDVIAELKKGLHAAVKLFEKHKSTAENEFTNIKENFKTISDKHDKLEKNGKKV